MVFQHISENAKEKEIWLDRVSGYLDHVHCLVSLTAEQNVSKVVQLLKGESSYWVNKTKLTKPKFQWAAEYYAASISQAHVESIRQYIDNQEQHHQKNSFQEEFNKFVLKQGFMLHREKKY